MPDRIIRESICTSETLNSLSDFEERFWHRLIVNCDDFGRFFANPSILRGKLFPLADGKTKKDMSDALNKLASVGLVELYEVDGKPFLYVVKWSKYQRTRAKVSKFPPPPTSANNCCQASSNVPVFECECDMREAVESRASAATTTSAALDTEWGRVSGFLLDNIDQRPSPRCLGDLRGYLRDFGPDLCIRVMEDAMDSGQETRKWTYIDKIFKRLYREGIKTLEEFEQNKADRETKNRGGADDDYWAR